MHISLTRVKSCLTIALSSPQVFQGSRQRMVRLALVLRSGGKNTEDTKSQKIAYALAPRSFDAKDREQTKLGRSPGFWLQTHLFSPSHPQQDSGCASSRCEEKSCSPVTVARLRRNCTGFPILPDFLSRPPSMNSMLVLTLLSIPISFLHCQRLALSHAKSDEAIRVSHAV